MAEPQQIGQAFHISNVGLFFREIQHLKSLLGGFFLSFFQALQTKITAAGMDFDSVFKILAF